MKKLSEYLYISVFLITVVLLGFLSYRKLMNFYINDEVDYNEWTAELGSEFETDIVSTFYNKFQFVNLNGAMRNIVGQQEMNGVVKLNNNYLLTTMDYCTDENLQKFTDGTVEFNEYLKKRGISLVYAATPYTSSKYDPELPLGINDYGNENIDRFVQLLKEAGVDTIDFRETMYEDGINHYDMMYKTDHHWTTEAGFYAYSVLEKYIINQTGCKVDNRISDINNYTITKYDDWHLGSRGQRTGIYYAGIDDFNLITPNFSVNLQDADGNVGTMQELMISLTPLENKDYTSRYTYDSVLAIPSNHYVNSECENDIKVLLISDSFANAVVPYMAMGFKEIKIMHDGNIAGITPELIEEYNPDVVIMLYYSQVINNSSPSFSFDAFSS